MLEPIPASTLILLRDQPAGPPEILMIERGAHLAFAGGNIVFPGGRVDQDDHRIANTPELLISGPALDLEDLVGRIAAIRETIEEIGLAPGVVGLDQAEAIEVMRAALRSETPFSGLLQERGLRLDPYQLHPFAHWLPKLNTVRRFDTRFYIARAPDLGEARADGDESSRCCWSTADGHIEAGKLMFPTRCNLQRIGQITSFDHAVAFFSEFPVRMITPWIEERDGVESICIPDDLGYPVTGIAYAEVRRSPTHSANPDMQRAPG